MKHIYLLISLFFTSLAFAQLTPPPELQAYYSDVDFSQTGITLKNDLSVNIISNHTNILAYAWDATQATDLNPGGSSNVLLIYGWENGTDMDCTNDLLRDVNSNGGSNCQWNREHVYPKSLGTPAFTNSGPGADGHHIRSSDVQRNGNRANRLYATGSGIASGPVGSDWYPGDEWRGDVARVIMYMYLRYGTQCLPSNVGVGSSAGTPDEMIDLFLQWNADDPVSEYEDFRNTYHANTSNSFAQGNRNPFIDNPYIATVIWGGPMADNRWDTLSIESNDLDFINIYPNPVRSEVFYVNTTKALEVKIYDLLGKLIKSDVVSPADDDIEIADLKSGIYLVRMRSNKQTITKKLIRQ
ncbi:MAG: endonuclease [Bacteroidia bacterium]|nr:endonuclease [Bacteroidia bacterium]